MSEDYFEIYMFRYKNKNSLPLAIYARSEETAKKILYWWNKDLKEKEQWYKPRFRFMEKEYINIEPYIFEQMQLDSAESMYYRRKEIEKNGGLL